MPTAVTTTDPIASRLSLVNSPRRTSGGFNGAFTYDTLVVRLRAGQLYVNVHTRKFPGGEIRGNFAKVAP